MTTETAPFWDLTAEVWPQLLFAAYLILAILGFGFMVSDAVAENVKGNYREATKSAWLAVAALVWPLAIFLYVGVWALATLAGAQSYYFPNHSKSKTETEETR